MALRHVIRRGGGVMTSTAARQVARGGGGPPQPPFARNKPVDYQVCLVFLFFVPLDDPAVAFSMCALAKTSTLSPNTNSLGVCL